MAYRTEHLHCLLDLGRLDSAGHIDTYSGWAIELARCPVDGSVSGFRWSDESGWEAVFVWPLNVGRGAAAITLVGDAQSEPFLAEEIAFELACQFEEWCRRG